MTIVANHLIDGNISAFLNSLLYVLALWGATFLIGYIQSLVQEIAIQKISKSIRNDLAIRISKMQLMDVSEHEINKFVSFMQNDVNQIEEKGFKSFFLMVRFIANGLFSLIALLFFSFYLFIVAMFLLIVLNVAPKILRKLIRDANLKISDTNNFFLKTIHDIVEGFEVLKVFSAEKEIIKTVDQSSNLLADAKINYIKKQSLVNMVIAFLNISSQLIIIFVTGILVFQNIISVGSILSTTELATKIFDSFGIVNQYRTIIDSISPLLNIVDKYRDYQTTSNYNNITFDSLKFDKLTFKYPNTNCHLISEFSYTINKGGKYRIVGPSGSGKSTLLRILFKQLHPESGRILLNGQDYTEDEIIALSQYLKQDTHIFHFDLDENITLGRLIDSRKLEQTKEFLNIKNLVPANLSGGEKQLVSLARILVDPHPLIVLDESFSNIDSKTSEKILDYLLTLDEVTLILISHAQSTYLDTKFKKIYLKGGDDYE